MSVRTTSKLKHMPPSRLRTPRSESMDDGGGDGDGRHEGARAAILAGVDTSPVLKPLEHILDLVPAAVEQDVMRDQHFVRHGTSWRRNPCLRAAVLTLAKSEKRSVGKKCGRKCE